MPLTNEQIETLFAFTKKKSVQYYDLQVELVDHLASSIEEETEKDAKLAFESALQKVYSRFGLFGFAHVVQEREKALWKQSWKLFWKTFGSHFTIPKIAFTVLMFTSVYLLVPLLSGVSQRIVMLLIFSYCTITKMKHVRQRRKTDIKPLLFTQVCNFSVLFPVWYGMLPNIIDMKTTQINPIFFAVAFILIIVLHLTAVQIDKQIRQKAKELYPEAFSVA